MPRLKKWSIFICSVIILGLIVLIVFDKMSKDNNKPTPQSVSVSIGTLSKESQDIWRHVVNSDNFNNIDGNTYRISVKKYSDYKKLGVALKSQDIFLGMDLKKSEIDWLNTNTLVSTNKNAPDVVGFSTYDGLKRGHTLLGTKFKENDLNQKQKAFFLKMMDIYNQSENQQWIEKNYPNYH